MAPCDLADSFTYTPHDRFDTAGAQQTVTLAMAPVQRSASRHDQRRTHRHRRRQRHDRRPERRRHRRAQLIIPTPTTTPSSASGAASATPPITARCCSTASRSASAACSRRPISMPDTSATAMTALNRWSATSDSFSFTVSDGGGDNPVRRGQQRAGRSSTSPANDLPTARRADDAGCHRQRLDAGRRAGVTVADVDLGVIASGELDFLRLNWACSMPADTLVGGCKDRASRLPHRPRRSPSSAA